MSGSQSTGTDPNATTTPLSVADAADVLGVSLATVRAHLRQGTLVGEKVGQQWVVYLAATTAADPLAEADSSVGQDRVVATAPAPLHASAAAGVTVLVLSSLIRLVRRLRQMGRDRLAG